MIDALQAYYNALLADEPPAHLLELIDRLGCTCGGSGVQDDQSYRVHPCGPECVTLSQNGGWLPPDTPTADQQWPNNKGNRPYAYGRGTAPDLRAKQPQRESNR